MTRGRTLRIALPESARYRPLEERLADFERETGCPVQVDLRRPHAELAAELAARLAEAAPLDLVGTHSRYLPGLAPQLLPLDDWLPPAELADFDAEALAACRWEGRLCALPRAVETRLLFYRSDIFEDRREQQWFAEASGGRELRVPRSWDELAAVAQYFTRAGKLFGFAFPGRPAGLVALFAEIVTTVGGTFFDEEGRPRFYSRAGEWALTLLRDLCLRWEAVPPETLECDEEDVSELFRLGRCALVGDYPDTARLLCDPTFSAVAGWHSVALYPAGPEGRRAVWTGWPVVAIPASCSDPQAALELLRFLVSPEGQRQDAANGALPSRVSVRQAVRESLRPGSLAHLRWTLAERTAEQFRLVAPRLPRWADIEAQLGAQLLQAIRGEQEPAAALEAGRAAAEALADGPA